MERFSKVAPPDVCVEAADILIAINGWTVTSLADVQRVLTEGQDAPLEFKFVRFGKVLTRRISFH